MHSMRSIDPALSNASSKGTSSASPRRSHRASFGSRREARLEARSRRHRLLRTTFRVAHHLQVDASGDLLEQGGRQREQHRSPCCPPLVLEDVVDVTDRFASELRELVARDLIPHHGLAVRRASPPAMLRSRCATSAPRRSPAAPRADSRTAPARRRASERDRRTQNLSSSEATPAVKASGTVKNGATDPVW